MAKVVPGSGASALANFNANFGVSSFTILNGGTGYASTNPPEIIVSDTQTPTVAGSFYPVIANGEIKSIKVLSSGSGYFPLVSAAQTAVGIASIGTVGSDIAVKAIYVANPGFGYITSPTVTIANPEILTGIGTYLFNEIVRGSRSQTRARVKSWDSDTKILRISNVGIGATQLGFFPGETIIGTESGALYTVKSFDQDETYDKYSQNDEIEEAADLIIDFSESNPFGNY